MKTLTDRLSHIVNENQLNRVALASSSEQWTYRELIERVTLYRNWLAALEAKLVGLHLHNSIEWIALDLACQEINVACVPLPTFFTPSQVQQCLEQAGADLLLSDSLDAAALRDVGGIEFDTVNLPDSVAGSGVRGWTLQSPSAGFLPLGTQKITFTSGSTGQPKGVCLSLEQQWTVASTLAEVIAIEHPRHLCLLPLSTLLENIAGVYSPLLQGGTVLLASDEERGMQGSSRLDVPKLLNCISTSSPSTIILIPQLLSVLVAACENGWKPPQSLSFIAVGGGKVAPELIRSAHRLGLPVYQGYGLSECGSVVSLNTASNQSQDSVGSVLPHCRVELVDSEVVVTGSTFLGYAGQPDTWYPEQVATGDIGYLEAGFLHISGRKKNLLITSFGRNISPEWVESVLMERPLLSQCIVLGDGKPSLCALLSAPSTVSDNLIASWIASINTQLPDYAQVGHWHRLEETAFDPYLTANRRLQRNRIEQAYSETINDFYAEKSAISYMN